MLKITAEKKNGSTVVLKLSGKIQGEWVMLLVDECRKAQHAATRVALDLAEVTYIDDRGLRVMQSLSPEQVRVVNCPAFVAELLGQRG